MKNLKLALTFCTALALVATFGAVQLGGSPALASTTCEQDCFDSYTNCLGLGIPPAGCDFLLQQCLDECPDP